MSHDVIPESIFIGDCGCVNLGFMWYHVISLFVFIRYLKKPQSSSDSNILCKGFSIIGI